jgi:NAD dependent epimerase/dehydratase family enzyme
VKAIADEKMKGPYNAVAPNPVTNRELTKAIASTLHKPLLLPPVPAFALKIILGEMADIIVTGSRISPAKIMQAGFQFQFTRAEDAVKNLLSK